MDKGWIKRPVWGPAFENGDLELPETTLQRRPSLALQDDWYVIACGSEDGELEVLETDLTLEDARRRAGRE
ncbi:MAG: hypothetical protein M0030_13040 [Actinomycetota bacterium]|nr:hypothetical protein [Actinomycetota bacterium]